MYPLSFCSELIQKNENLRITLKSYWEKPEIKEAIFLASNHLHDQLNEYFEAGQVNYNKGLEESFFKYLIRMSSRCTPFGLFSGICAGEFDKSNDPKTRHSRKTALDNNVLHALSVKLSEEERLKSQLLFFPNTSLYKHAGYFRYIDYQLQEKLRVYSIEAVEVTDHLEKVLSAARTGKTRDDLARSLVSQIVGFDEAKGFIELLIENKLLVSRLELNVTGDDALTEFTRLLRQYEHTDQFVQQLEQLSGLLKSVDEHFGNSNEVYERITTRLDNLKVLYERKYLFQTDLSLKRNPDLIDSKQAYAIRRVIPILKKLNPYRELDNLRQFKKAFQKRYQDQEVPLATVLDIESGIGYVQHSGIANTTPFLHDITIPSLPSDEESFTLNSSEQIIYDKLKRSVLENAYSMSLTDEDFEEIAEDWDHLPDTMSAIVEVLPNNQKSIYLQGFGNGAAKLMARFCHCDQAIHDLVLQITSLEKSLNPDKVMAEVAHLPETRAGNILKRPHLRDYEIPYITNSTLPDDQQLLIDDLRVSVKEDSIILKSERLGKEVLPRLTNAHNYSANGLPVYHFLCDLEYQNKHSSIGFSWPAIALNYPFLPRVVYKNIYLSKARWLIQEKEINLLSGWKEQDDLPDRIEKWRKERNIPGCIQVVSGDNTMLIDLEELSSIHLFLSIIKNQREVAFEEALHFNENGNSPNQYSYANEVLISFFNKTKPTL